MRWRIGSEHRQRRRRRRRCREWTSESSTSDAASLSPTSLQAYPREEGEEEIGTLLENDTPPFPLMVSPAQTVRDRGLKIFIDVHLGITTGLIQAIF